MVLIFGEEEEIGFFWGKKRKIWWIEKYLEIWKIWNREFITFQHNLLGWFLSIDALLLRGKRKKRKRRREVVIRVMNVYTHTHTHTHTKIFFWRKEEKKKIGSVVVVVVGEMKFGWLIVCYKSQRSKSGIQHEWWWVIAKLASSDIASKWSNHRI